MSATRLVAGTYREVWQESVALVLRIKVGAYQTPADINAYQFVRISKRV